MGKISNYVGKPDLEGGPIQTFDDIIWTGGRKSCLITSEKEPKKGGFYNDDGGGYVISSKAVSNRDGIKGFISLGTVIGDAILDSDMLADLEKTAIQTILQNIAYGIAYTIDLHKKNTSKKKKSLFGTRDNSSGD